MAWTGNLLANLDRLPGIAQRAALEAVTLGAEHILGESTKLVPIEEGTLSSSGKTSAEMQGGTAVAAISYDTPYAVRQHEEMDYRHDPGRQAKYLEGPLGSEAKTVAKIMSTSVRAALQ